MTAEHLFTYPSMAMGFWVLLALGIAIFSIIGFRYDREKGYALSVYSLPYSKLEIFLGKLLSIFLLSVMALYIPILVIDIFPNVDTLHFIEAIILTRFYFNALIFALYFVLFSIAISTLSSVVLQDMFLAFIASFFLLVLPFFAGLDWPPFFFIFMIPKSLAGISPFEAFFLFWGLVAPIVLVLLSGLIFLRRDVL